MVFSALASLFLLLLSAASFWLRPFTAEEAALEALETPGQYVVTTTSTAIRMDPLGERSSIGLIFQPGARVDARAYASILADIATEPPTLAGWRLDTLSAESLPPKRSMRA
jgi:hypothetical protein